MRKTTFPAALAAALLTWLAPAAVRAEDALQEAVREDYESHLGALFEHFHLNPELSFREFETAKRLAAELRDAGVEVTEGVGGTGLVGLLKNGDGPLVLVRTDMDGLPVEEDTGLPYASTARQVDITGEEKPVMHACGHDVHMAALVGTARRLAALRDRWSGTVMFVGQPAEERLSGARVMLADGLYERFGVPDFALGLHVSAGDPAGKVMLKSGLIMSSSDNLDLVVRGLGAHGASPHKGKDPIYVSAQLIVALQGLVSRELSPLAPGVVTVGSIHGGFKHNVIPDQVKLELTVRSDSLETRQKLLDGIRRVADGVGRTAGLPDELLPEVRPTGESTPPLVNDDALVERLQGAFRRELGEEMLYHKPRTGMGAEDFAYYTQTEHRVPGAFFDVGGTPQADLDAEQHGGPSVPSHHSPFFQVDPEPSVTASVRAMTVAVLELMGR